MPICTDSNYCSLPITCQHDIHMYIYCCAYTYINTWINNCSCKATPQPTTTHLNNATTFILPARYLPPKNSCSTEWQTPYYMSLLPTPPHFAVPYHNRCMSVIVVCMYIPQQQQQQETANFFFCFLSIFSLYRLWKANCCITTVRLPFLQVVDFFYFFHRLYVLPFFAGISFWPR